jgi:hypothetical protein
MGRPPKYNQEVADTICEEIATSSKSMVTICKELGVEVRSVFRWLRDNKDFCHQYACAREAQSDFLVEEMLNIADDHTRDVQEIELIPGSGIKSQTVDYEVIQRSKLRVDTRKWIASKLKPKKYGDKLDVTSDGEKLNTVMPEIKIYNTSPPMASSEDEIDS